MEALGQCVLPSLARSTFREETDGQATMARPVREVVGFAQLDKRGAAVTCATAAVKTRLGGGSAGDCGAPLAVSCPACAAANSPGRGSVAIAGVPSRCWPLPQSWICNPMPGPPQTLKPRPTRAQLSAACVRTLRRPRRLHDALGDARFRGGARTPDQVFRACQTIVGRYGGVVEKFIGDAVMAVWGTPVAREGRCPSARSAPRSRSLTL